MKSRKIKVSGILHHGNSSNTVLGEILGRACVIKRYFAKNSEEFAREKEALKLLDHPAIIRPFYMGKTRTFATDFIGSSLRTLILSKGVTREALAAYAVQIAAGLSHIHSKGIVHFDLKPENIIVSGQTAKIIDFGSAKYENEAVKNGDFTPMYAPLEYLIGLTTAHLFKDIWSYGCVLYEMCCHEYLFENTNTFKLIAEILQVFGSPSAAAYADLEIKHLTFFNIFGHKKKTCERLEEADPRLQEVFSKIFQMNPSARITAADLAREIAGVFSGDQS